MKKKVDYSVLMSVYSKEKPDWLKLSIESMLNQTYKTNNFVIIKDGPLTPELDRIINYYNNKYPEIFTIVSLEKNVGLGQALAIGIKVCKNEYIARMDSDDYSIPNRIEKQITFMVENDYDIVGSSIVEFIDDISNKVSYRLLPETHDEIVRFSKKRNPFGHPSVIFKRSLVISSGNYRDYHLCEDYDMWIRMIKKGAKCYNFRESLVYMRVSNDFYKRRGGIKYFTSILKFKNEQLKSGYFSFTDYLLSTGIHCIVCIMPNFLREIFYKNLLRKKSPNESINLDI